MSDKELKSLQNGLDLLWLCAQADSFGCCIEDVTRELDLTKSSAYRVIKVLKERGYLRSTGKRGYFALGFQMTQLARAGQILSDVALPILNEMVECFGETALLTVRAGQDIVYLQQVEGPSPLRLAFSRNQVTPLYTGACGKLHLAFLSKKEQEQVLASEKKVITDPTFIQEDYIRKDIAKIRKAGFALSSNELDVGGAALSVPVFSPKKEVIAGLAIAGPAQRLIQNDIPRIVLSMKGFSKQISSRFFDLTSASC